MNYCSRNLPILFTVSVSFLLIFVPVFAFSQLLGLEPPATKWHKISTPCVEVIYEPWVYPLAIRTADLIQELAQRDSAFIGGPAQKVPVILHSQSTLPAGVPLLAPWKSDWTITSALNPFMRTVSWIDLLSVHEYRHHQQMQRAKRGWFGAYEPSVNNEGTKLLFSEYTALGFELREMDLKIASWQLFDPETPTGIDYYQPLDELEGGDILRKDRTTVTYEQEVFKPAVQGLFKFHSWTPFYTVLTCPSPP